MLRAGSTQIPLASMQLPPIHSFRGMQDKQDVLALCDMITDIDDLFNVPNVRVFLPVEFPQSRNPFLLGKTVDELAEMVTPTPTAGNLEEELKVLELMRYKRAAKALLKAEAQVLNRLPVTLQDLERMYFRMTEDLHVEKLVRAVATLLANPNPNFGQEAVLYFLTERTLSLEPHNLLRQLNAYRGGQAVRVDVQASVRKFLRDVPLEFMEDHTSVFLIEWVNAVLSNSVKYPGAAAGYVVGGPQQYQPGASALESHASFGAGSYRTGNVGNGPSIKQIKGQGQYVGDLASAVSGLDAEDSVSLGGSTFDSRAGPGGQRRPALSGSVAGASQFNGGGATMSMKKSLNSIGSPVAKGGKSAEQLLAAAAEGGDDLDDPASPAFQRAQLKSVINAPVSLQGSSNNSSKKSKKKKETDKERKKREKEEEGDRIRSEVERILQEQGIGKRPNTGAELVTDENTLTSLRYELVKMQQELLRRKVLDPRHYRVASVDVASLEQHGLTVPGGGGGGFDLIAAGASKLGHLTDGARMGDRDGDFGGDDDDQSVVHVGGKRKSKAPPRGMILAEVPLPLPNGKGTVDVLLDLVDDVMIATLSRVFETDAAGAEVDQFRIEQNQKLPRKQQEKFTRHKEAMASMRVSKLTFNRLTGLLFENVVDEKSQEMRTHKLGPVVEQMRDYLTHAEPQALTVAPKLDRRLFKTNGSFDGVAMDVTVLRAEDCQSVTVLCQPKTEGVGSVDSGPVSIILHDKELQVLLINQRGLYLLAQSKWSCMEMVAQWVSTRIRVKSLRVLGPGEAVPKPLTQAQKDAERRKKFLAEGGNLGGAAALFSPVKTGPLPLPAIPPAGADGGRSAARDDAVVSALGGDPFGDALGAGGRKPVMLDVSVDRDVELASEAMRQWRTRNVPNIPDMQVSLTATQDLDMVRFEATLTFPPPRQRQKKKEEAATGKSGLVDFARLNAEEEHGEDDHLPVVLAFTFRLTCSELLIFGTAEPIEGVKMSMNKLSSGENHPSAFMWNVLSRMHLVFAGSTAAPYSKGCKADDKTNWELRYDRRLLRDIRTISGGVVMVTASAVGEELVYVADPTEGSIYKAVGQKVMSAEDQREMIFTEGWPLTLLGYGQRTQLAFRVLEKLKVVQENGLHRLEPYNFPESRMLGIAQQGANGRADIPLGVVEISDHFTLGDLRTIIRHELDKEVVPRLYRFLYKGGPCAVRQEPFRRAWECLPVCVLIPRVNKPDANSKALEMAEKNKAEMAATLQKNIVKLAKNQRRAPGKLVPVPVHTLARLQEDSGEVFLLHDHRTLLTAGDVVRFGNVLGRDYIIGLRSKALQNSAPKTIQIDPVYDLLSEEDFDAPTAGRSITVGAMPVHKKTGQALLAPYTQWPFRGFRYDVPESRKPFDLSGTLDGTLKLKKGRKMTTEKTVGKLEGAGGEQNAGDEEEAALVRAGAPVPKGGVPEPGNVWTDVWVWKCIPAEEDTRPPWRIAFDDGLVRYDYAYADNESFAQFFRVKASMRLMEIFVTDVRCPDMSLYSQRVAEMESFQVDFYTKLAFKMVTEWHPQYKRGVEQSKFLKMLREMKVFPDIKKPARISQLDLLFQKEVMSDNGIADKYVNYVGFCRLLQDVALIRFPPPVANQAIENGSVDGRSKGGDGGSVASSVTGGSGPGQDNKKGRAGAASDKKRGTSPLAIARDSSNASVGSKGSKGSRSAATDSSHQAREVAAALSNNAQALVDPEHAAFAYRKCCVDHVMGVPEWSAAAWAEAKLGCIKKEAKKYCAATRIAATIRGWLAWRRFTFFRANMVSLQAQGRRRIAKRRTRFLRHMLEQDWLFRIRYWAACKVNALVRRFLARCGMFRVVKVRREAEVKVARARRFRLKKIRQKEKKGIIYKETKRVNGIMVMLFISRKDARNYSKDFGIVIGVYVPRTSTTYKFPIEEEQLRKYMCKELGVDAVGVGDLLDKRNLQTIVSARLIIRKSSRPGCPPQVMFSKQAMGQRGAKALCRGRVIDGEHFICTLYDSGDEITVTCYHRRTSTLFPCKIGLPALREWILLEHQKNARSELEKSTEPSILRHEHRLRAFLWALNRIRVDTRKGAFRCLFECQFSKSRKGMLIRMIQAQWRRAIVRLKVVKKYDAFLIKVKSHPSKDAACYYIDRRSGVSSWEKPWLMGPWLDLTLQPSHRWEELYYYHEGSYFVHYVNPWSGAYSHFTQDRAARIMQSLVRKRQLRPFLLSRDELLRVVPFVKRARKEYQEEEGKRSLMVVINWALVCHVVLLDEEAAKKLFVEAIGLAEANPLVTRAFGLFVLGTCEAPVGPNRERALKLLADAKRRDETHHKFSMAHLVYRFGNVAHPRDPRAICNRALIDCLLFGDNWNGERMMRRALSIAPFEPRVLELWNFLKDSFVDVQREYQPVSRVQNVNTLKGGKKRIVCGFTATECPDWAGWIHVEDDEMRVSKGKIVGPFWFNPATLEESTKEPDWAKQWEVRRLRSQYHGEKHGLDIYFDPIGTPSYYCHHVLSNTYQ